jgi:hypothetical protein
MFRRRSSAERGRNEPTSRGHLTSPVRAADNEERAADALVLTHAVLQFLLIVYCAVAVANFASGVIEALRARETRKLDPAGWATIALAAAIWPVSVPVSRMERASAPAPIAIAVRAKATSRETSPAQLAGHPEPALPSRSIPETGTAARSIPEPGLVARSIPETTLARSQRTSLD